MADSTIDRLVLQIDSDAKSATSGIDALATSLGKLKSATSGGLGLGSIAKNMESLKSALSGMSNIGNTTTGLTKAIVSLSRLGQIKVSSTIGNQIKNIGSALSTLDIGDGASKIEGVVSALKPLETLGKSSLGTSVNALNKLPKALNKIDTRKLHGQISALTRTFKPLADEMQKIANGFNAFPSKIQKMISGNEKLTKSNDKTSKSYINLWAKMKMAYTSLKTGATFIAGAIEKSMDYTENVNLFNVAMGDYAEEARNYAEQIGDIMGIDPGEWMRNQGMFMTLATGFGVTSERANKMSKNMTQLGYDLSSFFNLPYEDAMAKLQSGLAGELEPLRRIGFDLSVARLEQEAYTLGITKKVSAMNQAEKAELRYHAIMTQVTSSHKDMARTLDAPANQMRVLKSQIAQAGRAIGNIFIPALQAVLPYCIAFFKVIKLVADAIAKLVGFKQFTADLSDVDSLASGASDYSDALGSAADNAKKLQKYTMGFDELNVIDPNSGSGSGSDSGVGGSGFDFELEEYDFLGKGTLSKVNEIVESIKENLPTVLTIVAGIGAAIAGWAVSKAITLASALSKMAGLSFSWSFALVGLTTFLQDLTTLKQYLEDFQKNGASFYNVSGMISTFAGLMGDALILLGNLKLGASLKIIEGIGQIVGAIHDMSKKGVNTKNLMSAINGLSNIGIAVGLLSKNKSILGASMALQGLTTVIREIADNWEAIKNGDWSGVDKVALVIGAIEMIGGVMIALGVFSSIKRKVTTTTVAKDMADVGTTMTSVNTGTATLSTKLVSLAKNLALGVVVIAEVAVAAGVFVGAIWGIGVLLEQVGEAWQPVIENGGSVALAMGIGTTLLAAIGTATAVLGSFAGILAGNIALGTAVLLEVGVATALFVAEILGIGLLLEQVGIAWQPVLDNGEAIATSIGVGTALLVAIGVVTAALGVATVATVGLLPLAIGLGTALLVELGVATALFLKEISAIGICLVDIDVAWQPVLNKGKAVETAISKGTELLIKIGVVSAALGVATVASVGLLPLAIALGSKMLEELSECFIDFCDNLIDVADKLKNDLHPALDKVNDILPDLGENMKDFTDFMEDFANETVRYTKSSAISGLSATINKIIGFFTSDPINALYKEVDKQRKQANDLNTSLILTNPVLKEAITNLGIYKRRIDELQRLGDEIDTSKLGGDWSADFERAGSNIAKFGKHMLDYYNNIKDIKQATMSSMVGYINNIVDFAIRIKDNVDVKKIDAFTEAIKRLSSAVKNLPTSKKLTIDVVYKTSGAVPKGYATGGFPQTGELFVAREAGPEMVGSIGRKTAVANNDQIVDGIAYGVSNANAESNALLREQNALLRELLAKDSGVYLDGKQITNSVEKYQSSRGRVLVTGGAF